jgi:hypothetical protein
MAVTIDRKVLGKAVFSWHNRIVEAWSVSNLSADISRGSEVVGALAWRGGSEGEDAGLRRVHAGIIARTV